MCRIRCFRALVLLSGVCLVLLESVSVLRASTAAYVGSTFNYKFNSDGVLSEANDMSNSWSPYWWLSSGGWFHLASGIGSTVQGSLPTNDYWRRYYASTNPRDTDNGYHPQNLFRLVTRSRWQNFRQQVYMRIRRDNLSDSPYRNQSNGLLLMNRYLDENNLYYTGIRVDGAAVIKKKYQGKYYTLAYARLFPGASYHRDSNPSLLPKNIWLGLRTEITNNPDGTVRIAFYVDPGPGGWVLVFDIIDNGLAYGPAIRSEGYGGFRTDFMDVEFENYWAVELD